jgi:4-amino-4-deoxy-L-arabinose transferase-like glycosyltransferase
VKHRLYAVLAGALLLTAFVLFALVPALEQRAAGTYALGFADDYDALGRSLANGEGYRLGPGLSETMMREPGYPLLLAGLFKLLGYGIEAARLANLLLAGATALLLWHLARRVARDEAAALVAVAVFLLHPGTLVAQARGGVEIVFMFAAVGFLLLLYRALEADRAKRYVAAGLALGGLLLIRSTPLLFALVLLPYLALSAPAGTRARRAMLGGVLLAAAAAVTSPWVARNYALSGEFVPTASVQGVAAQEGLYTCERLSSGQDFSALQVEASEERNRLASQSGRRFEGRYYQYFYTIADELAFNRALLQRAFARYRAEPALLARCSAANLVHFWFLGKNAVATATNVAVQLPLLACALAGLWLVWRREPAAAWAPVALFAACIVAVHTPVIAHARHSVPLVPFLSIFAACALLAAWRRFAGGLPAHTRNTA